ncbi:MAG: HD-GYP domain-containing protein [Desulfobacterales bacterium]
MDIDPFQDIIKSFSQISRMTLEIWGRNGVIYSTDRNGVEPAFSEDIRAFSDNIIDTDGFLTTCTGRKGYDLVGVPIHTQEGVFGSLIAYRPRTGTSPLHKTDGPAASAKTVSDFLSGLSGLMLDRTVTEKESEKMAEELGQSFEDLYLYSSLATQIKTLRFSSDILNELVGELLDTMRADLAFALLPERSQYNSIFANEILAERIADQEAFMQDLLAAIPPDEPTLAENYFILNDSGSDPSYAQLCKDPYRFLAVRVQHDTRFYGWLGLVSFNLKEIFRKGELRLLISVAQQVAVVLSNTDLYNDLESFVINVVKSLVNAIEAKDTYTSGHSERVSKYSMLIADQLGLDDEQKDVLNWAAILHDVGKIGIPESILNKPAKLTDEEFDIIKSHPRKGYDILLPIDQLTESLPGILHHHEQYDGSGYPEQLAGEQIPFLSRIISVADTYDAISSSRAYRAARSGDKAFDIVKEVAGTQLDPQMVEAFTAVYEQHIQTDIQDSN